MKRELILSSHESNNKPSDFTIRYQRPIQLDPNKQYEVGLGRIVTMAFTWFNIASKLENQLIRYSSDGGTSWISITFPPGVWTYDDIDTFIRAKTKTGTGDNTSYPITLAFDNTTFRVVINLATNYQLDLKPSNFGNLIGFNKKILSTVGVNLGDYTPNLSQDREMLYIHCDLISESSVNGKETDIIYAFSTNTLNPSASFTIEPKEIQYTPVNKNMINSIRIYITDAKQRLIDLHHSDTAFSLILKEM